MEKIPTEAFYLGKKPPKTEKTDKNGITNQQITAKK